MPKANKSRALLYRRIAVGGVCLAMLLLLEILGRVLIEPPRPKYWNPIYGTVQPPNFTAPLRGGKVAGTYRTNSLGFRGPEISIQKPEGLFRIVFLGGSVVEADSVPEEKIFAFLVEQRLNEILQGNPKVEAVVAAGNSRTSHYALSHFANRILPLDPDLIIHLDAAEMWATLDRSYEPTMYWKSQPLNTGKAVRQWLKSNSGLVRGALRLRDLLARTLSRIGVGRAAGTNEKIGPKDPPNEVLFRDAERSFRNIHRIALLAKDAGVSYAIMTQAWIYKPEPPAEEMRRMRGLRRDGWHMSTATARRSIDRYNENLRKAARDDGLVLIDIDRTLPKNFEHYLDDVHLTPRGHEVVADTIIEELMRQGTSLWRDQNSL